jgi:hypothetical protein
MKYRFWFICGILILLNFGLQGIDFTALKINACGYYYFNPSCMDWNAFLLNKFIRITINSLLIWLVFRQFYLGGFALADLRKNIQISTLVDKSRLVPTTLADKSRLVPTGIVVIIVLFVIGGVDVFLLQNNHFVAVRIHEFIHPIAFSPFVPMILIVFGWQLSLKNKL